MCVQEPLTPVFCKHHPGNDPAAPPQALLWAGFGEVDLGSQVQEGQVSFSVHGICSR